LRFLRAARKAGVRRFIASDYSMNLFTVPEGDSEARRYDRSSDICVRLLPIADAARAMSLAMTRDMSFFRIRLGGSLSSQ